MEVKVSVNINSLKVDASKVSKKALQEGRKSAIREVKRIYTIKRANEGVGNVRGNGEGASFTIKGKKLRPERYKAKTTSKGLYLTVIKGQGGLIGRSFRYQSKWYMRVSQKRLPITGIYSNSIPQLYQNEAVQRELIKAAERSVEL